MTQEALEVAAAAVKRRAEERRLRAEERQWRQLDRSHRDIQRHRKQEEHAYRELKRSWRREDIVQRKVLHSRHLWCRLKEVNRREVEERAEHMRSMSFLAALIAGFTMTAPVEFNYTAINPPEGLLTSYAIFTAAVPGMMTIAAMMCVFLLGSVLKMGNGFVAEDAEADFMARCRLFADTHGRFKCPPAPRRTFDRFWDVRCEDEWRLTFRLFCLGVTLFFLLLGTMGFLKFDSNAWIPIVFATILLVFGLYWTWVQYMWGRYLTSGTKSHISSDPSSPTHLPRPDTCGDPFDWHIRPSFKAYDFDEATPRAVSDASRAGMSMYDLGDGSYPPSVQSGDDGGSFMSEMEYGHLVAPYLGRSI